MTVRIDRGNGPEDVVVLPGAVCDWEDAHGGTPITEAASSTSNLVELAWLQVRADDPSTPDLATFRRSLRDVEPIDTTDPQ